MAECKQVNIPTVDETPLECIPLSSECVIFEDAVVYLGASGGENSKEIINLLVEKVKANAILIQNLTDRVEALEALH